MAPAWCALPKVVGQTFTQGEELALFLSSCVALAVASDRLAEHLHGKQQAGPHNA